MAIFKDNFADAFDEILNKLSISGHQIAYSTRLDEAYISRLRSGQKKNPSDETIIKICLAIAHYANKLPLDEIELLFKASGHSLFTNRNNSRFRSY